MTRPIPQLIRTPADAEAAACAWLRYWGFRDAEVTGSGPDGGADVRARGLVAQVKAEVRPTGRPVVQQLAGVAHLEGAVAACFSLGGYSMKAIAWSNEAGVALFSFDLSGEPEAINDRARALTAQALLKHRAGTPAGWDELARALGVMALSTEEVHLDARQPEATSYVPGVDTRWSITFQPADLLDASYSVAVYPSIDLMHRTTEWRLFGSEGRFPLGESDAGRLWWGSFSSAEEAISVLAAILTLEGLTCDDFSLQIETASERQAADLAAKGELLESPTPSDIERRLKHARRHNRSAMVEGEWARESEDRQWVESHDLQASYSRPSFSISMMRFRPGSDVVIPWPTFLIFCVPRELAQKTRPPVGFAAEQPDARSSQVFWNPGTRNHPRGFGRLLLAALEAIDCDLGAFDIWYRDYPNVYDR